MKRWMLMCLALVMSSAMAFGQTTSREEVLLQWKFKKGQSLRYKQVMNMEMAMAMPMGEQKFTISFSSWFTQKVVEVSKDGIATLKLKFDRVKTKVNAGPGRSFSFDSKNPDDAKKIGDPRFKALTDLVGKAITVKVDKTGKVQKIQGLSGQPGSPFTLKKRDIEDMFLNFPMGPIRVGASWTKKQVRDMNGMPMRIDAKFKLSDITKSQGRTAAKIDTKMKISMDISKANNPLFKQMKIQVKKSEGSGVFHFAIDEGYMLSAQGTTTIDMEMSGAMGENKFRMSQSVRVKNKLELIK
ncbi:MAG: hypothetical protein D6805_03370 [Planctomycetota bacterium]|nr:MAG: hypothetical protein D6805_03370 [Planctomycetota bacterium]